MKATRAAFVSLPRRVPQAAGVDVVAADPRARRHLAVGSHVVVADPPALLHGAGGPEEVPGAVYPRPAGHHGAGGQEEVALPVAGLEPVLAHRAGGFVEEVPRAAHVSPAMGHRARAVVEVPGRALQAPAGPHGTGGVEVVGLLPVHMAPSGPM